MTKALLLVKDIADMILESDKDDVQIIFRNKKLTPSTSRDADFSMFWEVEWNEDLEDTILVRLL